MNKVSIIMPIYNSEKYLDMSINSVLNQTYDNWELLLINDGSTDSSEMICKKYAMGDKRIRLFSQENRGVSAARNIGLDFATGSYITFLDSDDELEFNTLKILLLNIIEYNADIVMGLCKNIYKGINHDCDNTNDEKRLYYGYEALKDLLICKDNSDSVCAKLYKREFINDIRFDEGHNINEDGYFLFECYARQPVLLKQDTVLYKYFQRDNSASKSAFSEKYFDMIYFCDLKKQYINSYIPELIESAYDMEVRTHLLFLDVLCRDRTPKYRTYAQKSIRIIRKRYFKYKPRNKHERLLATVVLAGLYPLYRYVFHLKFGKYYDNGD